MESEEKFTKASKSMVPRDSKYWEEEENKTTVILRLKNPLELTPVIKCVLQFMNFTDLKNCRYISKSWSSAALSALKMRSKIVFTKTWDMEKGFCIRTPAMFDEEFSNTPLAIPFTAFEFYCKCLENAYYAGPLEKCTTKWKLSELNSFFQSHKNVLHELHIRSLYLVDDNGQRIKSFDMTPWISDSPLTKPNTKLNTKLSLLFQMYDATNGTIFVLPISSLIHVKQLALGIGYQIILQDKIKISPRELKLSNVAFFKNGDQLTNVCINKIFDFSKSKKIEIQYPEFGETYNVDFSLNNTPAPALEILYLNGVKLINYLSCRWTVKKLKLRKVAFTEATEMHVTKFIFYDSTIDISVLPKSIEILKIRIDEENDCLCSSQSVSLPNLNSLSLDIKSHLPDLISYFANCQLVELDLSGHTSTPIEINFESIPKSVKKLKLNGIKVNIQKENSPLNLDQLVLENYSFSSNVNVLNILTTSHFKTDKLFIVTTEENGIQAKDDFVRFLQYEKQCLDAHQRFYIGPFKWDVCTPLKKTQLEKYVNKKGAYYIFENRLGKVIECDKFKSMCWKPAKINITCHTY